MTFVANLLIGHKDLNHRASQNKAKNEIAYTKWVESFTPEQIYAANNARSSLKRKLRASGSKTKPRAYSPIKDSRQPHLPSAAHIHFFKEKHATGDLKGIPLTEASLQLYKEWNAMSETEKKVWVILLILVVTANSESSRT